MEQVLEANKIDVVKTSNNQDIKPEIITVQQLIETPNFVIPPYQRPYKWSSKNVNQLLDDILFFKSKAAYRLGTIVYHLDQENALNIVDGQQRSITLLLIGLAIENSEVLQAKLKKALAIDYNLI